jgi:hypothetical protein
MSEIVRLHLHVGIEDADADTLDRMTRGLRFELDEAGVEARLPAPALVGPGCKGEAITLGVLALAVLPEFAPKVLEVLESWLSRGAGRKIVVEVTRGDSSVKLELPVEAASLEVAMAHVERALGAPQLPAGRRA